MRIRIPKIDGDTMIQRYNSEPGWIPTSNGHWMFRFDGDGMIRIMGVQDYIDVKEGVEPLYTDLNFVVGDA